MGIERNVDNINIELNNLSEKDNNKFDLSDSDEISEKIETESDEFKNSSTELKKEQENPTSFDETKDDDFKVQSNETTNASVVNEERFDESTDDNFSSYLDTEQNFPNPEQETKKLTESDHWQQFSDTCKNAFDTSSAPIEKDYRGNDCKMLNQTEKEELSNTLKSQIDNIPKGERGDFRVPEPEKIKGVSQDAEGNTRLIEAWKDNTDGAKDGTREMETVKAKDESGASTYIDRIGSNNGNYFSPMDENGNPYSLRARATGDYVPEEKIEENDSYHRYEVKQDFTQENFKTAIDKTYTDSDVNQKMHRTLDIYYKDAASFEDTEGHDGESYRFSGKTIDGIKSGTIDNMFGTKENPDGGGKQYITPFNAKQLEEMGIIKELNKEDYT